MTKSSGSLHKAFFSYRYRAEYSVEIPLAPTFVSRAYDILTKHLAEDIFEPDSLKNLKGRDASQQLLDLTPTPESNEILMVQGTIYEAEESDGRVERGAFCCSMVSQYDTSKRGDIFHHTEKKREGDFPEYARITEAGRIFPAEISSFRLGLQKYGSRMFSCLLGLAPVISGSLIIDCSKDVLKLQVIDEAHKSRKPPWGGTATLDSIHTALSIVCDFDLIKDIEEKLGVSYQ